ncbi:retinol dehydrogenase 13-like [Brachionus plicatilis]|uniref:Retinol dehydrogenase 13-like n=1 Tax=Brachionus plicatilis TaxID=10195 RepID=A0A3M7QD76_BRAPC|nr:retinol dehydrogenase 13-like [Brachionus plicatilis]
MILEVSIYLVCIILFCFLANRLYFSGSRYKSEKKLNGKVALVTGSDCGIGFETALDFAERGARVILACRNSLKAEKAVRKIIQKSGNKQVDYELIDLSDLDSIKAFSRNIQSKIDQLDILVNNAGVMGCPESWKTKQGFDMQFGVNYLGHFLLTNLLLDLIKKTPKSRIINVSSCVHYLAKIGLDSDEFKGYPKSKLALVMFTKELAKQLHSTGVTVVSVHPGIIIRNTGESYCRLFPLIVKILYLIYMIFTKSAYEGAMNIVFCAIDDQVPKLNGCYFSDCRPKEPSKQTFDEQNCKNLWEISKKLVGL